MTNATNRLFHLATFTLLSLACLTAPAKAQEAAEDGRQGDSADGRPNIVFIFSDDHAVQALGAYGGRLAGLDPTPNLDRFAREGMLFRSAFATNAICAPSRAVILSGLHSHLNGVRTNRQGDSLRADVRVFPQLLQEADYQTAIVGKWHLKSQPRGFDYWEVLIGQGPYYNPDFRTSEGVVRREGYTTDVITDRALDWLEHGREEGEPFLLMYQHKAPHRNWQPGPDHLTTYDDVRIPAPSTLFYDYAGLASPAVEQEMEISTDLRWGWDLKLPVNPAFPDDSTEGYRRFSQRWTPEQRAQWEAAYGPKNEQFYADYRRGALQERDLVRWKYQRYLKDYLRTIASLDDGVGRVLDYLEENGLAENTVVVYSSDQGFYLGENGWFDKRWIYDLSAQMPLLVRWPGVTEPGSENDALVQNLDFAPTFLDIAGADVPGDLQGRSLVLLLKGESPDWREAVYYRYYEYPDAHRVAPHEGVRTLTHKLVRYPDTGEWELFDLERDPEELRSVYGDPAYADVQAELKATLDELKAQYEVPEEGEGGQKGRAGEEERVGEEG